MTRPPAPVSVKSLLALVAVVLAAGWVIYWGFGGEYTKAQFMSRFDFHKPPPPGAATQVDLRPLLTPTPQLLAEGQQVFEANCSPCHGPEGYGNGPRSVGLNPPPRNFHQTPGSPPFRFGTSVLTMYHTVTNGSPGTSMPSFAALTPEERMAAVQYVRQWIPKNLLQPNTPAQLAELATPASTGPASLPPLQPVPSGPRIPIDVAMQLVAAEAQPAPPSVVPPGAPAQPAPARGAGTTDLAAGADLYTARCASCHGADGQGGIPTLMVDSAPYLEMTAASFRRPRMLRSLADAAGFDQIVLHGLQGRIMPSFGTLTRPQLDSLYAYVQQLAGGTPGAATPPAATPAPVRGGAR